MPAKNMRMVQDMAGYLIVEANSQSGKTVKDLAELFGVSDTAVRNIIHKYKGFRRTIPDKWPTEFWFDISISDGLIPSRDPKTSSGQPVAGKYRTYVGDFEKKAIGKKYSIEAVEMLIDTMLQSEQGAKSSIERGFRALAMARRLSREFPTTGTLDKEEWAKLLASIVNLRNGLAQIVEFLDQLLSDERLNTPAYWMVFQNTIKE